MPVSPDSQGYIGNLHSKTLPELKEILDRQEIILKKENFVKSLPDKGRKIQEYADNLQKVIKEKENILQQTKALSDVKTFKSPSGKTSSKFKQERSNLPPKPNSEFVVSEIAPSVSCSSEKSFGNVERDTVDLGSSEMAGILSSHNSVASDDLKDYFQRLNVSEAGQVVNVEATPHSYVNNYEAVIKRGEEQERNRRKPFKINRTLKVEKVDDLPEKFKLNKEGDVTMSHDQQSTKHLSVLNDEDIFPKYKYDKTEVISIKESSQLLQKQKEKQEAIKAEQAMENLSQRLNFVMNDYGSKEIDMKYRENVTELDSDDELDPEYPEVD